MRRLGIRAFGAESRESQTCSAQCRRRLRTRSCSQPAAASHLLLDSVNTSFQAVSDIAALTGIPEEDSMRPSMGGISQCALRSLRQPAAAQAVSEGWTCTARL